MFEFYLISNGKKNCLILLITKFVYFYITTNSMRIGSKRQYMSIILKVQFFAQNFHEEEKLKRYIIFLRFITNRNTF